MIEQATKNGFSGNDAGINSQGLYKGFSVFSSEQRKKQSSGGFSGFGFGGYDMENCYSKTKIDFFRSVFPNNPDQSDPQYFRGFQPGDLAKGSDGKPIYLSEKRVRENLP